MNHPFRAALGLCALALATHAGAQITFYENEGFRGRVFSTDKQVQNFERRGFNDRASSVVVERGRWEVCEHARFEGGCKVLRRGSYDSLQRLGLQDRISSVRPVGRNANGRSELAEAPEPLAAPNYAYRRRPDERLQEVPVTSVRAVMGEPDRRCWVERQQVAEPERRGPNVGAAVLGAVIGGVLGHQVGGGTGKDIATVGGAVAGAAIGANVGGGGRSQGVAEVRRCDTAANGPPAYWDVTYNFKGVQHRVQMSDPPGRTITVNRNGEPRQ